MERAHQRSLSLALTGVAVLSLISWQAVAARAEVALTTARGFGVIAQAEGLREVGHGTLRWLGVRMYLATLWSADGRYGDRAGQPLALSLAYQRRFSRAELIGITGSEWTRLGLADAATRARWAATLERIWTDVEDGDEVTALVTPAAATRFYRADRLLGGIDDPAFGPAYLAIWLDARSAVGGLRTALISPPSGARP